MKNRIKIFEDNKLVGGYSLAVRDDWSYNIKRINVSELEHQEYIKAFGNEIITYNLFFDWWLQLEKSRFFDNNQSASINS